MHDNHSTDRIPELVDEQEVADLLDRQTAIIDHAEAHAGDPIEEAAKSLHLTAIRMAAGLGNYLESCLAHLTSTSGPDEKPRHSQHLLHLIDHATQLRAWHLRELEAFSA